MLELAKILSFFFQRKFSSIQNPLTPITKHGRAAILVLTETKHFCVYVGSGVGTHMSSQQRAIETSFQEAVRLGTSNRLCFHGMALFLSLMRHLCSCLDSQPKSVAVSPW